ncbi:Hypothetical protein PACV_116 [Pacmanvirus A23]|uniref:Hypothetical protein n=1 Tax=Pacmanvirus A23 TaxID=1932881 RepID=UPI000A093F48|nr:Hypothetical protein B9W72_gp115 [Pacmanvirus A23]SIP85832.1 Hypothetical protein PACV_116 [Pacmanvirus A23]
MSSDDFIEKMAEAVMFSQRRKIENYTVKFDEVRRANDFFCYIRWHLSTRDIEQIWSENPKHFVAKCAEYRCGNVFDAWGFYDSLDVGNQSKLVSWYNKRMNERG